MSTLNTYKSLKEISAIRFHEIKFEGNINLIDKDYEEEKKYNSNEVEAMHEAWIKLYDQYFEKTDNPSLRKELRNKKQTLDLLLSINLIKKIIEVLEFLDLNMDYVPGDAYMKTISGLGNNLKKINPKLRFDSAKPIKEQIEFCRGVMQGLETRYKILHKEDQEIKQGDIMLFYQIKSSIEDIFGRNIDENINMLQWIAYEKDFKKKVNGQKQKSKKRRANVK